MPPDPLPAAQNKATLLELAEKRFGPLSRIEEEIFRAAESGRKASASDPDPEKNEPSEAASWAADRTARGECIAWLCTDKEASTLVHYRGLDLRGVRVEGDLDLSMANLKFFFSAKKCAFVGSIILRFTEARDFHFSGCRFNKPKDRVSFKALDAESAKLSGSLYLTDKTTIEGEISLLGATIGADLDCRGAVFATPGQDALSADGIKVHGTVLLAESKSDGGFRFLGATIDGDFDCSGVELITESGLNGDGIKVEGDALFGEGFHSTGLVSFLEARIGGNFDCSSGDERMTRFSAPDDALRLESARIEGNVLFDQFRAEGEVNLFGVTVGGGIECSEAEFLNPEDALTADGMKVTGDLTFGDEFLARGEVRMFRAIIGGDLDCRRATFSHTDGALSADGAKISGDLKFSDNVIADGPIRFPGAVVGGNLNCAKSQFLAGKKGRKNEDDPDSTFDIESAQIDGSVFFEDKFVVRGEVSFIGAVIAGDLDIGGANLRNSGGFALTGDRAKVAGDVLFGGGCKIRGEVSFRGATIGGDIDCDQARFVNGKSDALNAEGAKIEGSVTLRERLELRGTLNLQNAEIRQRLDLRKFSVPAKAAIDLRAATVGTLHGAEANLRSQGPLKLDGFSYARFQLVDADKAEDWIKWLHQQPREKFAPQPFDQLAGVLRRMGYERDARRVMIAKNKDQARSKPLFRQGWLWYNVFGRLIGYGYAPWKAFALSMLMILLGWIVFNLADLAGVMVPAKERAFKTGESALLDSYPDFNPLVYSLESFTPLLKLDQTTNWVPNTHTRFGTAVHAYFYIHVACGWLLTSLWVGAVTGLVKS